MTQFTSKRDPVKLSVFIGSTWRDLVKVRDAIIKAILESEHIPVGMELWASDARPTLDTIEEKLSTCDLHVVILGASYGDHPEGEKISFIEWEYNKSKDAHRPVIAFLLDEKSVKKAWIDNPPPKGDEERYWAFRNKLTSHVHKSYSPTTIKNVGLDVVNALNQAIHQVSESAGWIRRNSEPAKLAEAIRGNRPLMRIIDRVMRFQTVGERIRKEPQAKKAAASLFWPFMWNRVVKAECRDLFLESGSSLNAVSEAFEEELERRGYAELWRVATNNALTLLQLMLFTNCEVIRCPATSPNPEDPYGAIFTRNGLNAYEDPPNSPRPLTKNEDDAIGEIVRLLKPDGDANRIRLILGTASGWDSTHAISDFQGPHVGSHANMLFKRAIFTSGLPVVLFLSRHKVDPAFPEARFKRRLDDKEPNPRTRYCYPVFGQELPLKIALRERPIAICVGWELEAEETPNDILDIREKIRNSMKCHLEEAGFDFDYAGKEFFDNGRVSGALIFANEEFKRMFSA